MNEDRLHALLDQAAVRRRVESGWLPDWAVAHYESFREGLLGERNDAPFPCYFGVEMERAGEGLYTFCDSTTAADSLFALGETLLEYLEAYETHSERAPLTVFFRPSKEHLTEAEYHERLWHVLQFLHVHDPEPWPEDVPTDPDDEYWEFCFGGEPMFPTCRAPFYDDRKSRYCPVGLEVTFQPRTLFEGLTADTETGRHAREVIQDRLERYDGVCPHEDLGDWGVEGDREWKQYLFAHDREQAPEECPICVTREHPKADADLLIGAEA
jgi:FPC/CPF motif-containing protein YcgG